jgi:hypothetical protein
MNSDESQQPNPAQDLGGEASNWPVEEATATEALVEAAPTPSESEALVAADVEIEEVALVEATESFAEISEPETLQAETVGLPGDIADLERQKHSLEAEIQALQQRKAQLLSEQMAEVQATLKRMVNEGTRALEERKQALELSIEQLERRRDRIREEMRTTFAGVSQDLAIRVQGFKDYLVGSLQDLAAAAEQLEFPKLEARERQPREEVRARESAPSEQPQFSAGGFQQQARQIRQILEQYRARPDYYGPPWQLRRTFEPIHAERVQDWFFQQGGRGTIRSMGSRLQNILIASAAIAVLHELYGERSRTLILADTPERLGEWRRGLQDCLGISRNDFGPERGIVLFESPEALVQKAERLVEQKQMPLVIVDEGENQVNLSLLQFPLWLAFAPEPQQMSSYSY